MVREKAKVRINPVKFLRLVIVLIVICGLLVGAGFLLGSRASRTEHEEMSAIVVQNQISAISELATVTYHYTELGQYESSKDFYGTKVPFTITAAPTLILPSSAKFSNLSPYTT